MINIYMNGILTILAVVGILILSAIIIFVLILITKKKNKRKVEENEKQNNEFVKIFGGENNIISCESKGSRLILVLKDYDLLDEKRLKENGVTSMIKATNKITLIVAEKSKELEKFIEEIKRP